MAKVSPTYDVGLDKAGYVSDFSTSDFSTEYNLIYKFAKSMIGAVKSANPMRVFDKGLVENGVNIEQAVLKLAESAAPAYDATANPFTVVNPDLVVRFFKDWTKFQFTTTVKEQELRKVVLAEGNVSRIAQTIVANLTESYGYEDYVNMKGMLANARTTTKITKIGSTINLEDTDKILTAMKNTISEFKFVTNKYNKASISRTTNPQDIVILMPFNLRNQIDVDVLAGVFNLDKAELKDKIIEIDEIDANNEYIYIVDKNAFQVYTRLYRLTDMFNPKGLYMNYFLTAERMYAWSDLFNTAYIQVDMKNTQV